MKNSRDLQRAKRICGQMGGKGFGQTQGVVEDDGSVNFGVAKLQSLNTSSI